MKLIHRFFLFLLIFTGTGLCGCAQNDAPFAGEIQAFARQDSTNPPARNAIVFTGSSSFRMWTSLQQDFPGYTIINRAFGGSTFPDVIRYANEVIFAYAPKQVVIYCGDNDLASSDTVTAAEVARRFQNLHGMIRQKLPNASIVFVSIKPSPSRAKLLPKMQEANTLISDFLKRDSRSAFVDVYHPMLDANGAPRKELFLQDDLHMNATGYAIWRQILQPYLLK